MRCHPVGGSSFRKADLRLSIGSCETVPAIMVPRQSGNAEVVAMSQKGRIQEMYIVYNGLWGLLVLAGDIWAVINIVQSSASNERKLLWILVVVFLPLLGLILWYFLGPRDGRV